MISPHACSPPGAGKPLDSPLWDLSTTHSRELYQEQQQLHSSMGRSTCCSSSALLSRSEQFERTGGSSSSSFARPCLAASSLLRNNLRQGSLKASIFTLASSTLGAGIVSLPFAFRSLGFALGFAVLLGLAAVSCVATKLLARSLLVTGRDSYEALAKAAGGQALLLLTQASQILFNLGAAAGYIVCMRDILLVLLPREQWAAPVTVGLTLVVLWPLSSLERMSSLRWTSLVGLLSLECLVVIIVAMLLRRGVAASFGSFPYWRQLGPASAQGALKGVAIVVFSLSCQSNAPMILAEMERPAVRRMNKVAARTAALSIATYALVGVCGFLLFGKDLKENVLLNFRGEFERSPLIRSALVAILVGVFFSFPTCIFPCRVAVLSPAASASARVIASALLVLLALVCAFLVPSVATLFALTGSVAGASIGFILPGCFALLSGGSKLQAACCIVLGAAVSVFGTLMTLPTATFT